MVNIKVVGTPETLQNHATNLTITPTNSVSYFRERTVLKFAYTYNFCMSFKPTDLIFDFGVLNGGLLLAQHEVLESSPRREVQTRPLWGPFEGLPFYI